MPANLTEDDIRAKLDTDQKWLSRAVLAIYRNQTDAEKTFGYTAENNHVGFNGSDSGFLTSIAKRLLDGRAITPAQLPYVRKKMRKYAGQLLKIAEMRTPGTDPRTLSLLEKTNDHHTDSRGL